MKTQRMTLCALFAALTAVCAQITAPIGPVPVNLALLPLLVCASVLPARGAAAAALVYIGMGAAGLPVFAGMIGGVGVLTGPTGGYILGYVPCAALASLLMQRGMKRAPAMALGVAFCHVPGALWLMLSAGLTPLQTLLSGVLPFLPGDLLKIFCAAYLGKRLYLVVHP